MKSGSHWRRRLVRLVLGAALASALLALAFCCLPLPIGWAINLAAKRALPPALALHARVGAATFRWRLGNDTARVDITGLQATVKNQPLAAVGALAIEIDKRAIWNRYYAPRLVAITAPQLVVDTTADGALAALQSAAAPVRRAGVPPASVKLAGETPAPPDAPTAPPPLSTFSSFLPAPDRSTRVRIDGLRVDYVLPGARWSLAGNLDATIARRGDDVHAEATANLGTREHPIGGTAKADVSLSTGKIGFAITLPEFRTGDLPPLPTGKLPVEGALALAASGEADYGTRTLTSGRVEFSFRDGKLTLPGVPGPPIALERIAIRGRAERRDGQLLGTLERGEIAIEGARVDVRKAEATLAPSSRLTWEAVVSDIAGARLGARLPDTLRASVPWLPRAVGEFNLSQLESSGAATVERNRDGSLVIKELASEQRVAMKIADAVVAVAIEARQKPGAPIAAAVRVAPFEPAKLARAFPAEWPLAAAAFPLGLEVTAHAAETGELLDAEAQLEIGAGELRAVAPLPLGVPITRIALQAHVRDKATRIEVPSLVAETALGRVEVSNVVVSREPATAGQPPGRSGSNSAATLREEKASVAGRAALSGVAAAAFEKLVPADALKALRAAGLSLGDFALRRAVVDFRAELKSKTGADWQPSQADAGGEAELGFAGKPVVLRLGANLPMGATEATAHVAVREFSPADFAPRRIAGVELADFRFPIGIEASAKIAVTDGRFLGATLRGRIGAGEARVAPLSATLPLRGAMLDAEFDPQQNLARISSAKLQLAPGIEAGIEHVTVAFAPKLHVAGRAVLAPLALRDALAWWPETLLPEIRAQAAPIVLGGTVRTDGVDFELTEPNEKNPLARAKARGTIVLQGLSTRPPGVPGSADIEELRATLDLPKAEVRVRNARVPAVIVESAQTSVDDVFAARPLANAQAAMSVDASAAKSWSPTLPSASGKLRVELSARSPADPKDFTGAKVTVAVASEKLTVPGMFDGPLQTTFRLEAPKPTELVLEGKFSVGDARLLSLDQRPKLGPMTLSLVARDWLAGASPSAELSLAMDDLAGLPLRVKAAAQFVNRGEKPTGAQLSELTLGRTQLAGAWNRTGENHDAVSLRGARIDVAELAGVAAPWLRFAGPGKSSTGVPPVDIPSAAARSHATPARLDLSVDFAEINFGHDRRLRALTAEAKLENNWPASARLTTTEGERNLVSIELTPAGNKQQIKIGVADAAALARTLTEPLRTTPLPPGELAATAKEVGQVPLLISGGTIGLEGEIARERDQVGALSGRGSFLLSDATMIRAPRVLQLLAFKSGQRLEQSPLIRKLSVGEWSFDPQQVIVKAFGLEGSGLIDRVKLNSVRYAFGTEKILIDGEYFGVGFEVIGTRADPQVFLKENKIIRAIGQRNEFDVFFEDEPAKTSATAKKK